MRWSCAVSLFCGISLLLSGSGYGQTLGPGKEASTKYRVWIGAGARVEESDQPPQWRGIRADARDILSADTLWEAVSGHTQIVQFPPGNIERARDAALQKAFNDLARRHMALALGTSLLVRSDRCASNTEAYGRPEDLERVLKKIQRNGGHLQYIAMDEPFFFGHRYSGPGACHDSAVEIAREIAENLKMVRSIFPNVKVGDIEVTDGSGDWMSQLVGWVDTYRSVVGEPLAFLHADVVWSGPAMSNLVHLATQLKQRGVPFGITYNADENARTDKEWTQNAISHFTEIETALGIQPDDVIFETWTPLPSHMLPEDQPGAFMNIPFQYIHKRSSLTLTRNGNSIKGRLTDLQGNPLPRTGVTIDAIDAAARMGLTPRQLAAVVPINAASAIVGIRANTEGSCVCSGDAGAAVGRIRYREQGTGRQVDISPVTLPIPDAPPAIRSFSLTKDKTFAPNLKQFPVTAGKAFTLEAPIMATADGDHAGYVMIVFQDSSGKGIQRYNLWFTPSSVRLDSLITDADGRFNLELSPTVMAAHPDLRASFGGNREWRPSMAFLPLSSGDDEARMPALIPFRPIFPSPAEEKPLVFFGPRPDFLPFFNNERAWDEGVKEWNSAAPHIQVIKFSTQYLVAVPDSVLSNIVQDLHQKHMGLGLESLATNWFHETPCGGGIEGYSDPGSANTIVSKLLKVGGSLDYIEMDEPLWFGHYYIGKNACKSTLQNLAARVAVIIKIYTAAFPGVVVGDTEPFPAVSNQPNWETDYAAWVREFHKATGTALSFLHLDFNWGDPHLTTGPPHNDLNPAVIQDLAKKAAFTARSNGLQTGVIYDGAGGPNSDAQWMQQARTQIQIGHATGNHPHQV
ncbi:MAG: hypothetical protein Q8927_21175, partial [Bacteroidota bacterium]|nr:hypothetical protein [Bacteroidota bacterium]